MIARFALNLNMHRGDIAVMDKAREALMEARLVKLLNAVNFAVKIRIDKHNRGIASGDNAAVANVKILPAERLIVFKPRGSV